MRHANPRGGRARPAGSFRNLVVSERLELASRLSMFSQLCLVRCGRGFLNASSRLLGAGLPRLIVTNLSRPKPVFSHGRVFASLFRGLSKSWLFGDAPRLKTRRGETKDCEKLL